MRHSATIIIFIFGLNFSCQADTIGSEKPPSLNEFRKQNSAQPSNVDASTKSGSYRTLFVTPKYLTQISGLRAHARMPNAGERAPGFILRFCECTIDGVLDESPNRKTYFFKPYSNKVITDIMLTVWHYKQDGAILDASKGIWNVRIKGMEANFTLARSKEVPGALIKMSWMKNINAQNATMNELTATLSDSTDVTVDLAATIMNSDAEKLHGILSQVN